MPNNPEPFPNTLRRMSKAQADSHMARLLRIVKQVQAKDTTGTMIVLLRSDGAAEMVTNLGRSESARLAQQIIDAANKGSDSQEAGNGISASNQKSK
jgi:hypothetical protein